VRIGIDARPLAAPPAGIGRYTSEILKRLANADHEIYLYSHAPLVDVQAKPNVTVRSGNVRSNGLGSLFAQARFPAWIRRDALDVFWSPRHHLPLLTGVPTVLTIHDLVWRKVPESMVPLGRLLERLLMPPSLHKAASVITVSNATLRDLAEYVPATVGKSHVIHEAAFRPVTRAGQSGTPTPAGRPFLLFVGTFEPRKNLPGLLEAFRRLIVAGNRTHQLVLAGNPGWGEDVGELIRHKGLSGRVEICHPGSQLELEQLYSDCEFLVLPSLYEGFCLPLVEAMSFGKPVVTSNRSSMPEVAGQAGLLVDPHAPESIMAAMARLISSPELAGELARRARVQAAQFCWDRAASETLAVIEATAAGVRTRRYLAIGRADANPHGA